MKRLRVAIAGAGMVSRHHLVAWSRCPAADVVGIADPDIARGRARANEFKIPASFSDAATMLDQTRPDALDIAAGHEAHAALCDLASDRGVAILCQKPLAATLDAARLIAARVGTRVPLMVHENWRHRPYYRQAQTWIAAGRIGRLRHVLLVARGSGLVLRADGTRAAFERQPMLAGLERLTIGEVLVHHLDVVDWLLGPLTVRSACLRRDVVGARGESAATVLLDGSGGSTATVEGDLAVPGKPARVDDRFELLGTEGWIGLEDSTLRLSGQDGVVQTVRYDVDDAYQHSYDAAIAHFANALARREPFETPPDVHLRVLALVEEAYRLAESPAGTVS